ncbi:hypothetical protein ETAA8_40080 [Anatilimnocola aggregata]|uniref:Uncharacterized protein n=1 Tax=Anatilimnocola aggregata TaxID=2528021 RepID=A0A517YFH2_9BACT|nr:hypothetical protein [Anatilimnocola aggregata]QDU28902.1 hypothetical protein ETAA8_40080 [Anatilimnocola aggregata]
MTTPYVATRAQYVLVEAADETEATSLGQAALQALYAARLGKQVTISIRTIRPPTADEIQLQHWHNQMSAAEAVKRARRLAGASRTQQNTDSCI